MRILITSASHPSALALARVLSSHGHTVLGADTERIWRTSPARYLRAYTQFTRLRRCNDLARVVEGAVEIIIPFGTQPHGLDDILSKRLAVMRHDLFSRNEIFQDFVRERVINTGQAGIVKVPMAWDVQAYAPLKAVLVQHPLTTFCLQRTPYVGFEDGGEDEDEDTLVNGSSRSSSKSSCSSSGVETEFVGDGLLLSYMALDDSLSAKLQLLPMSHNNPCRVTELLSPGTVYSAHALVNGGRVLTFAVTTCSSTDSAQWTLVSSTDSLFGILYNFTNVFVAAYQQWESESSLRDPGALCTHINIHFDVREEIRYRELVRRITALGCDSKPHGSIILLCKQRPEEMALAYTDPEALRKTPVVLDAACPSGLYSLRTVVKEIWTVFRRFRWRTAWLLELADLVAMILAWELRFKEEMWDWRDPLPALVEWFVCWPLRSIRGWWLARAVESW
ncbi:hypothetical protein BDV95DRAFT_218148 [Massariosphaeria phaeospora]|uniref:ATP-grasp domain-containing protein n=1 Tax=Massariosphaeria phaeospora TaxID=100035 RepID=A0A7C8MG94_9PLEO|nr:hypothetical protein BDV95DRAFT_218148 [Massariosphaeria phaeospora]